jgi:hypothetical protein
MSQYSMPLVLLMPSLTARGLPFRYAFDLSTEGLGPIQESKTRTDYLVVKIACDINRLGRLSLHLGALGEAFPVVLG